MNTFSIEAASPTLVFTGLEWIRAVQQHASPFLTLTMKIITNMVSEYAFMVLLMALFWVWNEKKAFALGILVLVSAWLNEAAKTFFSMPRPFHVDPSVGMIGEKGFGFPSGHAQFSLILAGALAYWLSAALEVRVKETGSMAFRLLTIAIWITAALICLLVSFSRIYLGVHFPWDIAGGWALGTALLLCFCFLQSKRAGAAASAINTFFARRDKTAFKTGLAIAAITSFLMIALLPHNILPGALFLGFTAGFTVMQCFFPFSACYHTPEKQSGRKPQRNLLLILAAGFAGTAFCFLVLKAAFPGPSFPLYRFFRFVRYALLGFWISGGAPWVFRRFPAFFGGTNNQAERSS